MSAATDLFIETARGVSIASAIEALGLTGLKRIGTGEEAGPCPIAGGRDGFAINTAKNRWVCRKCDDGGRDAIGLAAHVVGLDVKRRADFLEACSMVSGESVPEDEALSDERRAELAKARDERRAKAERETARRDADSNAYREREQAKARGKWTYATPGGEAVGYLSARLGHLPLPTLPFVRTIASEAYWHGQDEAGRAAALYEGPAMVLPFVDAEGTVIGCHLTWLDDRAGPKFRPVLRDPASGETLPTKKMRGTKKGGLLPLIGWRMTGEHIRPEPGRHRLVTGEGIENTLAVGLAEGFRVDTLYAAAGDLGNLAGRADPKSGFPHPSEMKTGKDGRARPVRVPGPIPHPDMKPGEAMPIPDGVSEVLLVGDGDSEAWFTASALGRAAERARAAGAKAGIVWPIKAGSGCDFTDIVTGQVSEAA
ncbi:MAG: primase-helicase zinc-binding domain-containing protein [Pseudomonadota bacterium]|nr:primase-helicase zinc-binding domain-containing protein [Pseudomonadota bacterium]